MPQQRLDYQSPSPRCDTLSLGRSRGAAVVVGAIIAVANIVIVVAATSGDDGFRAMGFAYRVGPFLNVVILLVSLLCTPVVRRSCPGAPLLPYILVSVIGPVAAIICDPMLMRLALR